MRLQLARLLGTVLRAKRAQKATDAAPRTKIAFIAGGVRLNMAAQ